jgi:hypothetical protein
MIIRGVDWRHDITQSDSFVRGRILRRKKWRGQENWYQFVSNLVTLADGKHVGDVHYVRAQSWESAERTFKTFIDDRPIRRDGMFAIKQKRPERFDLIEYCGEIGKPRLGAA